ncbi:Iron-chelate-transporting ATPase [Thalassoporum mexicanum PCC 7367]|uniref:ABC transporter ATP-binding protein n=1 Tax=Thalassoporum mexicanum TaxID=3457544 RepID=UPI00029FA9D7|nr:ABC transporter ATP-binding protein [Pseudanabaena sp. PCC 7367]AFY71453.1 Iron-chelate-transporting ATPase [Pseudanabaena sp. PCC 7367]
MDLHSANSSYSEYVPRLEARKLSLAYDCTIILERLNLAIHADRITVLVGPNGCGKSTLLRGLARLMKPNHGQVYLDGRAIAKLPTKAVAKRLGILPQSPVAPEGLTVKDLVAQGRYPHQNWFQQWSIEDEQQVERALALTEMREFTHRPIDSLSGGQRQRAWIAMTLAQNTNTLLLDEPTTFLDLAHQIEILDLLQELNYQEGRTIVMVLHDLNQACRYADDLVAIKQGHIYNQGSPEAIMTEALLADVFGINCKIMADPVAGTPMCIPIGKTTKIKSEAAQDVG